MWEDDHALEDGLSELRAAASVEELHRLLVTRRVSGRSTRHQEAVELFVHHHSDDPGGAVDTAVLLCTEWRWNRCTAKLIVGICATGILDDLALDELADRLLWPDRPRVRHPLSWLGLSWRALDLASGTVVGHGVDQDRPVDTERSPTEPRCCAGPPDICCAGSGPTSTGLGGGPRRSTRTTARSSSPAPWTWRTR